MKNAKNLFVKTSKGNTKNGGDNMTTEDRRLMVETISEIKELKE
jgi:deoxyribose-phosphate aldolase